MERIEVGDECDCDGSQDGEEAEEVEEGGSLGGVSRF
jgi:hypothetical protein